MAVKWLTEFILLFQPEESPRFRDEKYAYLTGFRPVNDKSPVSVKALIWTVFAIVAGLAIGQL